MLYYNCRNEATNKRARPGGDAGPELEELPMSELLETVMLICFGLSWPFSLVRNIKAHSAKGMSLLFSLLIIAGYAAGITAKVITHRYNYVLVAYLLNLAIVLANVVVYFINREQDKKVAAKAVRAA